jgi:hypothetical protein
MNTAQQQQSAQSQGTDSQPGAGSFQPVSVERGRTVIDTEHRHMDVQSPSRIGMIDCEVSR